MAHEPTPQESIDAGAGIVCFSGDKLLGGPQAGVLVGKSELIGKLKKHPLTRALRLDKMAIAALEMTLLSYLRGEAEEKLPIWRMIGTPLAEIEERAGQVSRQLLSPALVVEVVDGLSTIGGGSLPGETLPTRLVSLRPAGGKPETEEWAAHLTRELRLGSPPVISRIDKGAVLLDLRTVFREDEPDLIRAVRDAAVRCRTS